MKLPKDIITTIFHNHRISQQAKLEEWRHLYEAIHGRHNSQRRVDLKALESEYSIQIASEQDFLWLIFCLEAFYSICLRSICVLCISDHFPKINDLFSSSFFQDRGIVNFLEPNPHSWIESLEDSRLELEYQDLFSAIKADIATSKTIEPIHALFEDIFPRSIRHSLGEYYTPPWLAKHMINELAEFDIIRAEQKFLDPTCGSGVFINSLIDFLYPRFGEKAFAMVAGYDIREISVLAAKTNLIIKYSEYAIRTDSVTLPIWCKDILEIPPSEVTLFSSQEECKVDKYDFIVGNPPWINWEYLPKIYRNKSVRLWSLYQLWQSKGMDQGFIKEDISSLITYIVADCLLKEGGQLCFVLKESLFKSVKQGNGFRKFKIATSLTALAPIRVEDLTRIKVFEGASTRATVAYFRKGGKMVYPIEYIEWRSATNSSKKHRNNLVSAATFSREFKLAKPSDSSNPSSGWVTYFRQQEAAIDQALGSNSYIARTGIFTGGLNAVFWVDITKSDDSFCTITNITERAKNSVTKVVADIEKDYLYPLVAGRDVSIWSYEYSKYIILPHTCFTKMHPIDHQTLSMVPNTQAYLKSFQVELEGRKGFTSMDKYIKDQFYYALQRIGQYTFSPYKVGWKYICKEFTPFVFGYVEDQYLGKKLLMPNEKIIYVGLSSKAEAYYLCGLLSSNHYKRAIEGYMVGTQITPSILKRLSIAKYNPAIEQHQIISDLCCIGHQQKYKHNVAEILAEINNIVEFVAA